MKSFLSFLKENTAHTVHAGFKIHRRPDNTWGWERGSGYDSLGAIIAAIENYIKKGGSPGKKG